MAEQRMTTEELKKLLQESTPGPWQWDGDPWNVSEEYRDDNAPWILAAPDEQHSDPVAMGDIDVPNPANAALLAASWEMARELIELRERDRWIPIPKQSDYSGPESIYVLLVVEGKVCVGFRTTSYEWCNTHGMVQKWKPSHYMALPCPPSETEEKKGTVK